MNIDLESNNKGKNPQRELRELVGIKKVGYSAGILGQILPFSFLTAMIFNYFVYTIGLNPLLVSIGTAGGLIINAIASPICGVIADNKKPDRFGKRKSLLLIGLFPYLIAFTLIWMTPKASAPDSWNFGISVLLWIYLFFFYLAYALIRSTYLSMMPEQCETKENRIQVSKLQGIFSAVALAVALFAPIILMSGMNDVKQTFHTTSDGQTLITIIPIIALIFGLLSVILTLISFFSADESFHKKKISTEKKENQEKSEKKKFKDAFKELNIPLQDISYKKFLVSSLLWYAGLQIIIKNLQYIMAHVLELKDNDFNLVILFAIPSVIIGFIIWSKFIKNNGLKLSYTRSMLISSILLLIGVILLIPMNKIIQSIIAICILGTTIACIIPGYILPNAIISYFTDESEKKISEDEELSGSYFGIYLTFLSIGAALGDLIVGIIFIIFDTNNPNALALIFPLISGLFILSIYFVKNIKMEND